MTVEDERYFRDVYDHLVRLAEEIDGDRELRTRHRCVPLHRLEPSQRHDEAAHRDRDDFPPAFVSHRLLRPELHLDGRRVQLSGLPAPWHRPGSPDADRAPRALPRAGWFEAALGSWRLEYIQSADEQEECVFCFALGLDDDAGLVLHRGRHAFVLLNRYPYASGHLMVAPYRHEGASAGSCPRRRSRSTSRRHRRVRPRGGHGPQGFNLGWNLGRVAGAGIVDHVHQHVVPRWAGDTNFMPVLADVKVMPEARRRLGVNSPRHGPRAEGLQGIRRPGDLSR